ncbi:MAG TPA: sulfatase-like hydrolase/transferase [Planctomycetota bacterium]|nr:sulfatase-like hydrolase/transferase [Planctomycetota bacterium]
MGLVPRAAGILGLVPLLFPACSKGGAGPPNLVVFTLDTTRADRLGCYGAKGAETGNLDRIAREGVRFASAVTPVPQTLPAHCTIFTGRTPPGHTIRVNGGVLPEEVETLAERLASRGYETAAFVGSGILAPSAGLRQGFATYDREFPGGPGASRDRRGEEVLAALEGWLARRSRDKPAFVWAHFYDPHDPYDPPEPHRSRFAGRPYEGEIAYMDACLGRAWSALEKAGLLEEAIVVAVGDHGEGLGDHGEATHSVFVYEAGIRVPLLLWSPARWKPCVVEGTARLQDVAPTILEALGMPPLPGTEGESLLAAVRARRVDPPRPAYLETLHPYEAYRWSWIRGIRTEEWKFVDSVRPELYRLADDPGETRNLLLEAPERRQAFEKLLDQEARRAAEVGAGLSGKADPNAEDALRSLGYAGGTGAGLPAERPPRDPKDFVHLVPRIDAAKEAGFGRGDPRRALVLLLEIAPLDPTNPEIPLYLGLFSQRAGDLGAAEVHLTRALELDPKSAWGLTLHGIVAGARGDVRLAEARFREGIRRLPSYAQLKLNLAILLLDTGRSAEAEKWLREATVDNPASFDAWEVLGDLLAPDPARSAEALAAYERAAALRPNAPGLAEKSARLRGAPR